MLVFLLLVLFLMLIIFSYNNRYQLQVPNFDILIMPYYALKDFWFDYCINHMVKLMGL